MPLGPLEEPGWGAKISEVLFDPFGPYGMMFMASAVLASTLFLSRAAERSIPAESRASADDGGAEKPSGVLGGFEVVFANHYLLLIALMVFVINWLTAAGDNILSSALSLRFEELSAQDGSLDKQTYVGSFYGDFFAKVTLIGFLVQLFLVSRFFRWFGIAGTLMIPVAVFLFGFLAIGFFPVFALIRWVFIIQKSNDYSVLNTTRNALFLPVGRSEKYEGKTTIETFFWRFGDLASGGATLVFRAFYTSDPSFIKYNIAIGITMSFVLVLLAWLVGQKYKELAKQNMVNAAPLLNKPIPVAEFMPGERFRYRLPEDTFIDNDPGDLLAYHAELHDGDGLPSWLSFDSVSLTFSGEAPTQVKREILIQVTATDDEGLFVQDTLRIRIG